MSHEQLTRLLGGPGGPPHRPLPVAVLTMELQRGVVGDLASFPELAAAVAEGGVAERTATLLAAARRAGASVVHCTAEFRDDLAGTVANTPLHSVALRRPDHLRAGSAAAELLPELGGEPGDVICPRLHGVSPFGGTSLDALLRNLGVRVVVATGVSVNVAVTGLCIEAANLGYQVVLARDAVTGVPSDYAEAVIEHSLRLLATVATVDELVSAFAEAAGQPAGG